MNKSPDSWLQKVYMSASLSDLSSESIAVRRRRENYQSVSQPTHPSCLFVSFGPRPAEGQSAGTSWWFQRCYRRFDGPGSTGEPGLAAATTVPKQRAGRRMAQQGRIKGQRAEGGVYDDARDGRSMAKRTNNVAPSKTFSQGSGGNLE